MNNKCQYKGICQISCIMEFDNCHIAELYKTIDYLEDCIEKESCKNQQYEKTLKEIKTITKELEQTKIPFCTISEKIKEKIEGVLNENRKSNECNVLH